MPRISPSTPRPSTTPADRTPNVGPSAPGSGPSVVDDASAVVGPVGDVAARYDGTGGSGSTGPRSTTGHAAHMREVLHTYFAPYDDPIQHELTLIREIIEAKKADPRTFPDGENPFQIQYAVYNLRNPDVVNALMDAARAGVDVQVLIEHHQLDPAKTWNTTDETLIAAGFEFSATHKGLNDAQKKELDLIGIQGSGLMHLKTRLFTRPDPTTGEPSVMAAVL
jgi:hypothetical protein